MFCGRVEAVTRLDRNDGGGGKLPSHGGGVRTRMRVRTRYSEHRLTNTKQIGKSEKNSQASEELGQGPLETGNQEPPQGHRATGAAFRTAVQMAIQDSKRETRKQGSSRLHRRFPGAPNGH